VRAGLWDETDYWTGDMERQINTLQRNPGRKKVSVAEASWTVWDYPYMRRGLTAPDYYNKGQLLALLLDIEIRDATDNGGSLDDVMRGLLQQCAESGRGFADGDVRQWCEKVGKRSFEDFFAGYVEGTEELPFEVTLEKVGLQVTAPQSAGDEAERRRGRWKIEIAGEPTERALRIRRSMTGQL
jgi:predicted metalloprotease with PDZ domain